MKTLKEKIVMLMLIALLIMTCFPINVFAAQKSISGAKISGITTKTWNGKGITQKITVKLGSVILKNGTDYTVRYSNNKNVGRATVYIIGKGKYTGTVKKTFNIRPKGTKILKLKRRGSWLTVTWRKQPHQITGYQLIKSGSRFARIGYQPKVTIRNINTVTYRIRISPVCPRYRVWIRTYRKAGGKVYCSTWSEGMDG